jgi:hypothetical protein
VARHLLGHGNIDLTDNEMKYIKAFTLAFFFFCLGNAHASFIDHGNYITDTETHLDWLKISQTTSYSIADILAGSGGYVTHGWRYATQRDFNRLVDNYFGTDLDSQMMFPRRDDLDLDLTREFLVLFEGYIWPQSGSNRAGHVQGVVRGDSFPSGWIIDIIRNPGGQDYGTLDAPQQWWLNTRTNSVGSFLIREGDTDSLPPEATAIPEPSTFAILSLGLAGFVLNRRK